MSPENAWDFHCQMEESQDEAELVLKEFLSHVDDESFENY